MCVQVWRIEDLELVPVDPEWFGYFYGGDCYLIMYTYLVHSRKCYFLYIWQVRSLPIVTSCPFSSVPPHEFDHLTIQGSPCDSG